MCTILFGVDAHPDFALVVAANRDEFRERPTQAIHWWEDFPQVLAGRDLTGGGSWMGITREGRFAAVTNYRAPSTENPNAPSRGALVSNFLTGNSSPEDYAHWLEENGANYNGFNLLFGFHHNFWYYGNRGGNAQKITPGIHGLSNALLDDPWPKVKDGKADLARNLNAPLFDKVILEMLANPTEYPDDQLPNTGVPYEWEKQLSALCINGGKYGTRSSSLLTINHQGQVHFVERLHPSSETKGIDFDIMA